MKNQIYFFLLFSFLTSCATKKEEFEDSSCPCKKKIQLCDFYTTMESYLKNKGLLASISSYYRLIKDVRNQKVKIKPSQIWTLKKDPSVEFSNDHYVASMCIDSLYRVNPELYWDSKAIVHDFEMRSLGRPVTDAIFDRASSEISKGANHFALQHCLWNAILESHTIRINAILETQSKKGIIDLDSIDFDNETIKK
jgi:hypothetical protein